MSKASIAVAIIARDATKTIGQCLRSVVPYVKEVVVCVDAKTVDDTPRVAKRHGAHVFRNFTISEWHECPEHGKIEVQHFARARQASFAKLRKDVDWYMWLDADDTLIGGERLEAITNELAPQIGGIWLPYEYARVGADGPTSTLFDRERIVRTSMPWEWQYRVHEVLAPVGIPAEQVNWTRTEAISVRHQGEGHDTVGSARRNITLLEIDLETNSEDMRAWFYLGNQYFALADWVKAVACYERATAGTNPYQLWQSLIYLSMAYEKLGDLDSSEGAALRALRVQPGHPEPWYRMASCAMLQGDVERTMFWTKMGDRLPDPPFFVFRNPLDRTFNARLTLANAYGNAGMTSRARMELEKAAKVVPSQQVLEGIKFHKQVEEDSRKADAWVEILPQLNGEYPRSLPEDVWRFGRVRDVLIPGILKKRQNRQPRIIFYCSRSVEPWAPPSINTTGIGGSETAVIQIAKRFAADGWRVDVYNDCDKYEGVYDDVGYWDCKRLAQNETAEALVSWRNSGAYQLPVQRRLSLLWCHDLNRGPDAGGDLSRWDRVLGVSKWHADYLAQVYELQNTAFVPNGIELERFSHEVKKVGFRCVYASSPDRGLERLLHLWPQIVEQEPTAELHIAYGWKTIDRTIAYGHRALIPFKEHMVRLIAKTPRVVWRGRLPQDELAKLYGESYALLYPSDFLEVSCIVAMEAMAAGCVVVASGVGALPETVGDGGIVVAGNPYTNAWCEFYTHVARGVLHSPDIRTKYQEAGRRHAQELTWDASYMKWQEIVTGLLEGEKTKKEMVQV